MKFWWYLYFNLVTLLPSNNNNGGNTRSSTNNPSSAFQGLRPGCQLKTGSCKRAARVSGRSLAASTQRRKRVKRLSTDTVNLKTPLRTLGSHEHTYLKKSGQITWKIRRVIDFVFMHHLRKQIADNFFSQTGLPSNGIPCWSPRGLKKNRKRNCKINMLIMFYEIHIYGNQWFGIKKIGNESEDGKL